MTVTASSTGRKRRARASVLPEPVKRWVELAGRPGQPAPRTIYLEGPARFKRGRLPYLPMHIRIWNWLGHDRVSDLEVRLLGVTVMRGLDAYVDGRGFTRVGGTTDHGPEIDQGSFHVVVVETLFCPDAWPAELRWESIDANCARVVFPFRDGPESAVVCFDPATGVPTSYTADRHRAVGGPKLPWTAWMSGWREVAGVMSPSRIEVQWSDAPQPWLTMRIETVRANEPMEEPLARARAVLDAI
jgi:hypothetical protein